jgi:hypothetical protein
LDETAEQGVRPAQLTRENSQTWRLSTAGTRKSIYWRGRIDAGRTATDLGVAEGTAFIEYAADPDADPTDPATWNATMPALCPTPVPCRCSPHWRHTITQKTVAKDLADMGLSGFKRSHLNLWPDESDEGWAVVPRDVWEAARL